MRDHLQSLPPIRDQLQTHGLWANKALGQHFLLDLNITRKIVRDAGDLTNATVIEVGPGPGGLTRALLETDLHQLIAIEKDDRVLPILADIQAIDPRLHVHNTDAMTYDWSNVPKDKPCFLVANLPYNVGTPLLVGWLKDINRFAGMALMFQREVADRIVAQVGDKTYGRLAVLTQAVADAHIAFTLPASAFTPPPKVDSAVVVLAPKPDRPSANTLDKLETITAAAFGQRRKMLRQSLKPHGGAALCERACIDPTLRAENLDVDQFMALVKAGDAP